MYSLSPENLLQLGGLQLRSLGLRVDRIELAIGPRTVPGLAFPESLTSLSLAHPAEPGLLSVLPTGLQGLWLDTVMGDPAEGPGSLFSGMARLQSLTSLEISNRLSVSWPPVGPAYSAFTASSNLVELKVVGDCPAGVWRHVFPAARKLPHLTLLQVSSETRGPAAVHGLRAAAWDVEALSCLVRCCPSLQSIVGMQLQHGMHLHVSELCKLTALTGLMVYYAPSSTESAGEYLKALSALTQLRVLRMNSRDVDMADFKLLPLTSLTALTSLELGCTPADRVRFVGADSDEEPLCVRLQQAGPEPDVWLQLLERCADDPDC